MIKPMSGMFYIIYALCGISDILDGYLARKYNVTSKTGAIFDSLADFIFIAIMLFIIVRIIHWNRLVIIWVISIAFIRFLSITIGFIKFHTLVFLHTYTNKATGAILFLFLFLYKLIDFPLTAIIVCSIASISALEELIICIKSKKLNRDVHSLFEIS